MVIVDKPNAAIPEILRTTSRLWFSPVPSPLTRRRGDTPAVTVAYLVLLAHAKSHGFA